MSRPNLRAALFRSVERFEAFERYLEEVGVDVAVLDFDANDWLEFDYETVDFLIYYSPFDYSSSHPLATYKVRDNLTHLARRHPELLIYPDPRLGDFYNDKYRQFLHLSSGGYPIAPTVPLYSPRSVDLAADTLGFPMVVKNRYGAGGGSVFRVDSRGELEGYYRLSQMDLASAGALKHFWRLASKRIFYYHLLKARKMTYPLLSPPLLAQQYITHESDLKTVVGGGKVVEAHWRRKAHGEMWKVNIDDGGIGEWSHVPDEPIELSVRLAKDLGASWINLDFMISEGKYLISEFSPVWHHYAYQEKPSFVYKDDYNIDPPLDVSLNLEKMIVDSLVATCEQGGAAAE